MKIKGDDMLLFRLVEGKWVAIACSTACELDVEADVSEVRHPCGNSWKRQRMLRRRWQVNSAQLLAMDEAAWLDVVKRDEALRVLISVRENEHVKKPIVLQGDAVPVTMNATAGRKAMVQWGVTMMGVSVPLCADLEWILEDGVWNMQGEIWKDFGEWVF